MAPPDKPEFKIGQRVLWAWERRQFVVEQVEFTPRGYVYAIRGGPINHLLQGIAEYKLRPAALNGVEEMLKLL